MKNLFLTIITLLTFYSCAPVYVPNSVNTPLLTQQGELNANINVGVSGIDPLLSYAITDELSVMINGSFASLAYDEETYPRYIIDLAAGYNHPIAQNWIFESYGGFSLGESYGTFFDDINDRNVGDYQAQFQRLFVQPAFGFRSDVFDLALANRLSLHKVNAEGHVFYDVFTEPVLNAKLGFRPVKLTCGAGLTIPVAKNAISYAWFPVIFHFGIQVKLFKDYTQ